MTMKKRLAILTLTLAAIAAVPLYVHARGGRGDHATHGFGHGGHGFGGPMAFFGHLSKLESELDLTDAQSAQIKAIFEATHEQSKGFHQQLRGGFHRVAATLIANPNDVATAQSLIDQQEAAERAWKANLLSSASKALNVLTPEQRAKLADHLAERSARWETHGR
jgi:periplasmic protein CpxP/Spy